MMQKRRFFCQEATEASRTVFGKFRFPFGPELELGLCLKVYRVRRVPATAEPFPVGTSEPEVGGGAIQVERAAVIVIGAAGWCRCADADVLTNPSVGVATAAVIVPPLIELVLFLNRAEHARHAEAGKVLKHQLRVRAQLDDEAVKGRAHASR